MGYQDPCATLLRNYIKHREIEACLNQGCIAWEIKFNKKANTKFILLQLSFSLSFHSSSIPDTKINKIHTIPYTKIVKINTFQMAYLLPNIYVVLPQKNYLRETATEEKELHRLGNPRGGTGGTCHQDFAINKEVPLLFLEHAPFFLRNKVPSKCSAPPVGDAS